MARPRPLSFKKLKIRELEELTLEKINDNRVLSPYEVVRIFYKLLERGTKESQYLASSLLIRYDIILHKVEDVKSFDLDKRTLYTMPINDFDVIFSQIKK
tara:strand:+ start:292 stop:591 length:300 start_codon:yes stop_codon:yes gene_type:complete